MMQKIVYVVGFTATLLSGLWQSNQKITAATGAIYQADTLKDSVFIPKDTLRLIDVFAPKDTARKDTLPRPVIGLQRDTTYRPDTAGLAKKDSVVIKSEIKIDELSHLSVCSGVFVTIGFVVSGPFNDGNEFTAQMSDATGKFTNISESNKRGPIRALVPSDRAGNFAVRVVSSNPVLESKPTQITILPLPSARIEFADGGLAAKIGPGQTATYRVNLTGAAPWSFALSDGTTVANTLVNPYAATVRPAQTTAYKVLSVGNACGSGTAAGEVIVQVSQDTLPVIALKAVPRGGFRVCTGLPFQVNFNATGKYQVGNGFVVQLADSLSEKFINISDLAESPIVAKMPPRLAPGRYKMRVVSTFPTQSSDTADVLVSAAATTFLRGDSLEVAEGQSANLTVEFKGGAPWFVLLSDGTYENDIRKSPYQLKVSPFNATNYTISSAGGFCGVGDFAGRAFVNVKIPPTTIATGNLSAQTICAGTEIVVPFSSTGRFYAANQFVVQIADTAGKWVNLPTTGAVGSLRAKILPPFLKDTISVQQIRVISTAPAVEGTTTTLKVYKSNVAQAQVTGGGFIRPGGASRLKITFKDGLPPYSFTLSDGTVVNGTFINPYQMTVTPRNTTDFKIISLTNACGTGVGTGYANVRVETN